MSDVTSGFFLIRGHIKETLKAIYLCIKWLYQSVVTQPKSIIKNISKLGVKEPKASQLENYFDLTIIGLKFMVQFQVFLYTNLHNDLRNPYTYMHDI